jgi:hypothetical protein
VRATAVWVCDRLVPGSGVRERMRHDPDPLVRAECGERTEATEAT